MSHKKSNYFSKSSRNLGPNAWRMQEQMLVTEAASPTEES